MRVSDKHCSGCPWLHKAGKSRSIKYNKTKGACTFVRCVKKYGFKSEQQSLQERIGG